MRKSKLADLGMLRRLQYFEVVARNSSVSAAALEIGVSPSAVSHQLRDLTSSIGEELVVKQGRGIALTDVGRKLYEKLAKSFSDVDAALADVVGETTKNIRIAVCTSFGPAWLAPRLPTFLQANPGVEVELNLYVEDPEQTYSTAEAIVSADSIAKGYQAVPLFEEQLLAVVKPELLQAQPEGRYRLITTDLEAETLGEDWQDFAALCERPLPDFKKGDWVRCSHYLMAMEIAKNGMGVALIPDFLAAEPLSIGSLVCFDPRPVPSRRTYRLCFKSAHANDPTIRALSKWIASEACVSRTSWEQNPQSKARKVN